jgi:hypothetical protein
MTDPCPSQVVLSFGDPALAGPRRVIGCDQEAGHLGRHGAPVDGVVAWVGTDARARVEWFDGDPRTGLAHDQEAARAQA